MYYDYNGEKYLLNLIDTPGNFFFKDIYTIIIFKYKKNSLF